MSGSGRGGYDPNNLFGTGGSGSSGGNAPRTPGQSASGISVPLDVWQMLQKTASTYGIPPGYLTAAIYYTRDGGLATSARYPLTEQEVASIAQQMADAINNSTSWDDALTGLVGADVTGLIKSMMPDPNDPQFTVTAPSRTGLGGTSAPSLTGFKSIVDIQTAYDLFNAYYGHAPANDQEAIDSGLIGMEYGLAIQKIENTPEAKTFRESGAKLAAVKPWADALYKKYGIDHAPSPTELKDILDRGYNQDTLEAKLRAQQVPGSTVTVGALADARQLANKWAQSIEGRDASEGEVQWMLSNKVPINDLNISAFYQQMHDHAVWHGAPDDWLAAQKRAQTIWQQYGLPGKVDPNMVNSIIDGKLTDPQFTDVVKKQPAPGFPDGVTVGEVDRLRQLAESVKKTLFPGEGVTDAELHSLIGKSPDDIRTYYRSIVPPKSATGLPIGVEQDTKTIATQALQSLGVIGRDPKPEELAFFAASKMTADQIVSHYANLQEIVQMQPGAPYGMTKDQFDQAVARYGDVAKSIFGGKSPLEDPSAIAAVGTKEARDKTMLGSALNDKLSPEQLGSELEQFRQTRGRAPNADELRTQRAQPKQKFGGVDAIPAYQSDAGGPTSAGLGGTPKGRPAPAT
jgi:hypothetical protein